MTQPARPDHPRFGAFISEHPIDDRIVMRYERGAVVEGPHGEDPTEFPAAELERGGFEAFTKRVPL